MPHRQEHINKVDWEDLSPVIVEVVDPGPHQAI
jgi:hypothetical protein